MVSFWCLDGGLKGVVLDVVRFWVMDVEWFEVACWDFGSLGVELRCR